MFRNLNLLLVALLVVLFAAAFAAAAAAAPVAPDPYNAHFFPIQSLAEEDKYGLTGMDPGYNSTQPPVTNATQFAGYRIGILVAPCFEEVELLFPWIYFTNRSARVDVIAPWWVTNRRVASCWYVRAHLWAISDLTFQQAASVKYDALIVVGGIWSSTVIRNDPDALALLQQQVASGRLLAAVCSGTTALINAGLVAAGRPLTGSPSIRIDLENAGGDYHDQPVVVDGNIIWGRSPQDMDSAAFSAAIANYLAAVAPVAPQTASKH